MCLSVREDISEITRAIFTNILCMLPMSVARSSSGMLTIGRIANRREGGDGSAQRGQSVIYDYLVVGKGDDGCPAASQYYVRRCGLLLQTE